MSPRRLFRFLLVAAALLLAAPLPA